MHGWLLVWSPPPRPLCPTITHTHSGTGGVGHGGAWWCACALCVPPTPPSHSPSLPPPPPTLLCHHRPHTHTRDLVHAPLPHTHATCTNTHQGVLCVDHTMPHPPPPTPSPHSHTHHMAHTHGISHTATMVLAIAHHAVHSHTQLMPHTHHTGDRPRPSTPLAVAFREPPPPRWSCPFALLSSSLLVHQPLFSLSQACTHTPLMCSSPPPCHPSRVWCVVVWGWTAPSTTVVVKHATHTLVDHCVDGSHHPTLHPPSTLTPFCAFATTNHHAIPLLQPPPHTTTRPLCSSTAHSSASHTHTWC